MQILLAAISGLCALVVFGFRVRNLIRRPRIIAEAKFPDYVRASYNMSTAITLCSIVAWGAATVLVGIKENYVESNAA